MYKLCVLSIYMCPFRLRETVVREREREENKDENELNK